MKKLAIIVLLVFVIAAGAVYFFRKEIFQYSIDVLIMKNLPEYITIKKIDFDFKNGRLEINGFGVKNPEGYENKYLAWIDALSCRLKRKGPDVSDGIEITDIIARGPRFNIERLRSGRFNINEMGDVMKSASSDSAKASEEKQTEKKQKKDISKEEIFSGRKLSDMIKLSEVINIKDGKIVFVDRFVSSDPIVLIFGNINGDLLLKLSNDFKEPLYVKTRGGGIINGDDSQRINWRVSMDPTRPDLTMANRIETNGVDITLFKPYYDRFSPVIIKDGRFSGDMVFDFERGNIGSANTLRLSGLKFEMKENVSSDGWQASLIPELIKYLQSASGEIVFDFTIKGSMLHPRFDVGPIVRKQMQTLVVNKAMDFLTGGQQEGGSSSGEGKSDAERVTDLIRGLF